MESFTIFPDEMTALPIIKTSESFFLEGIKINAGIVEEDTLSIEDCYEPENTVLVKKNAFSCNYRDKSLLLKSDKHIKNEALKGDLYFSHMGSDFVGEVIAVGKNITEFKVGDRVIPNISYPTYSDDYIPGVATNYASVRIEDYNENKLIKIPDHITIPDEKLAAFPISAFTAYSLVRKVIKPNARVLVTAGRSGTSLAAISALKKHSVSVYVMTSSSEYDNRFKAMGVKDILHVNHDLDNYLDDPTIKEKVIAIGGFDAIIDPFYDIYLPRVIDLLAMDSKYVTCGLYNQFSQFDKNKYQYKGKQFSDILFKAMVNNVSIIGNCIGLKDDGLSALEDMNNGVFDIVMDSVFTKGEEAIFLDRTYNAKDRFGKVVYKYKN